MQTTLPPSRRSRTGRLCSAVDDQIYSIQNEASKVKGHVQECKGRKRVSEEAHRDMEGQLHSAKVLILF